MKVLILRFSSFGDILQTLSVVGRLQESFPGCEIHWATRADFVPLVQNHPGLKRIWSIERKASLAQVLDLGRQLREQKFSHIYDAHNNLRSRILGWQLNGWGGWRRWGASGHQFLRRPIYRWRRWLLFNLRWNLFPQPFSGQGALLEPLSHWGITALAPKVPQLFFPKDLMSKSRAHLPSHWKNFVTLAPSAAFPLKRWPLEYWRKIIEFFPQINFVILGGAEDQFLQDLVPSGEKRILNLAGKLNVSESAALVMQSSALVANDTGLMHVAEQVGLPCVALMGPAPFGFPSRATTKIMQLELACRPCSKHGQGPCRNKELQKCLRGISPEVVRDELRKMIHA